MRNLDDQWREFDQLAARLGLGSRQQAWRQRLSLWPQALIWAVATVLVAPLYYLWRGRWFEPGEFVLVTGITWLLVMAIIAFIQLRAMHRRSLRLALYQGGVVLADGPTRHAATWDELSVSVHKEPLNHTVTLTLRPPQGSSVVSFNSGEWPLAGRIGGELQQRAA